MSDINLNEFLAEGTVVRTKHSESRTWVTNVIYGINSDCIEMNLGLEKNYIDNLIMVGDTMKIKYTTNAYEYTLFGWVATIKADFPQRITIRVHRIERFDNKRDSYRFDVYLSSVIRRDRKVNKGVFAIMSNISRTGAAFVVGEELEKLLGVEIGEGLNNVAFFEIYVSPDRILSFEGALTRKKSMEKGLEYGVRIIDMDIESEKNLNEFLMELENKDIEFYNKRGSF